VLQVAKSLGIFDEVNKLKVLPGSAPSSANLPSKTLATKNVRYMEVRVGPLKYYYTLVIHR